MSFNVLDKRLGHDDQKSWWQKSSCCNLKKIRIRFRTPRNTILILLVIWLVSICFSLPQFTMGTIEPSVYMCYIDWPLMAGKLSIPPSYSEYSSIYGYNYWSKTLSRLVMLAFDWARVVLDFSSSSFWDRVRDLRTATKISGNHFKAENHDILELAESYNQSILSVKSFFVIQFSIFEHKSIQPVDRVETIRYIMKHIMSKNLFVISWLRWGFICNFGKISWVLSNKLKHLFWKHKRIIRSKFRPVL